jgi:hypothetical protein
VIVGKIVVTQLTSAKRGIATEEMKQVAKT